MAMVYGDAPAPGKPEEMASSNRGSLALHKIPTQSAPPIKKVVSLKKTPLKALGNTFLGFIVSPAAILKYSGPAIMYEALIRHARKPWNLPNAPSL